MFPKITPIRLVFVTLIVICASVAMACYFSSAPEPSWMAERNYSWLTVRIVVWSPIIIIPGLFALLTWISIIRHWTESSSENDGPTRIFTATTAAQDERQRMMSHPYSRRNLPGSWAAGGARK